MDSLFMPRLLTLGITFQVRYEIERLILMLMFVTPSDRESLQIFRSLPLVGSP